MWRFFKNFIVLPLVFGAILLTCWSYGRQYLGEDTLKSSPVQAVDKVATLANHYGEPVVRPFKKLLRPVLGRFFKQDYTTDIHEISVKQLEQLLNYARTKNYDGILVYLYSLDCGHCSVNYSDINEVAGGMDKDKLLTMGIAVNTTPEELSAYMNISGGLPKFKPFVLKKGDEAMIAGISYFADSDYTKPPYIGVIGRGGRLIKLPQGFGRSPALVQKLQQIMKE